MWGFLRRIKVSLARQKFEIFQLRMAPVLRPSKRRKKDVESHVGPKFKGPEIQIRLTKSQAEQFGIEQTTFMEIEKLEYVTFNSDNADYLYYISGCVFNVSSTELTLYHSVTGADLADDADEWEPVETKDIIKSGNYLIVFEDETGPIPFVR
jgi:hypothetical protein